MVAAGVLGQKQELAEEVRRARLDPFAGATLLAEGASALMRIGAEPKARRAFGELCERAPRDPWARAFVGDRLRAEGWFDDATAAYSVLEDLVPDDPAASVRLVSTDVDVPPTGKNVELHWANEAWSAG